MLHKVGTTEQLNVIKNIISENIFKITKEIVESLDRNYGAMNMNTNTELYMIPTESGEE